MATSNAPLWLLLLLLIVDRWMRTEKTSLQINVGQTDVTLSLLTVCCRVFSSCRRLVSRPAAGKSLSQAAAVVGCLISVCLVFYSRRCYFTLVEKKSVWSPSASQMRFGVNLHGSSSCPN
ncbi:uncharacterized protein V6R79_019072 [Siganus canaliculatus]